MTFAPGAAQVLQAAAKQKMASLHPAVHDEGVDGGLRASSSVDNEKATHQADGQSMSESQMEGTYVGVLCVGPQSISVGLRSAGGWSKVCWVLV